jgi:hypothetical protein
MLVLESDGAEPGDLHRQVFSELVDRYSSLSPAIAEALFVLWEPHLEDWNGDAPPVVTTVHDMLQYTTLDYVDLAPPATITLGFGFVEAVGWDDAMFSVKVQNWQVSPGSLDD